MRFRSQKVAYLIFPLHFLSKELDSLVFVVAKSYEMVVCAAGSCSQRAAEAVGSMVHHFEAGAHDHDAEGDVI